MSTLSSLDRPQPADDETPDELEHLSTQRGRLASALEAEDWSSVTVIIERHWSRFMMAEPGILDIVFRKIPASFLSPVLIAVQEIRLRIRGPVEAPEFTSFDPALPSDSRSLEHLARSGSARYTLSAAVAFMVAYRLHGRYPQALRFANLAETAARAALRHDPQDTLRRIPSVLTQIGITRLLADRPHEALLAFREAFDNRQDSDDPLITHETTGKLALLFATWGNSKTARHWLLQYRSSILPYDPVDGIEILAQIAETLAYVDNHPDALPEVLEKRLNEFRVNSLEWGDAHAYARTLSALHDGDVYLAKEILDVHQYRVGRFPRSPFFGARLDALRGDVLCLLGNATLAYQILQENDQSSAKQASLARLHLLAGEDTEALQHANSLLSHDRADARAQLDASLTAALASRRLGHLAGARGFLQRSLILLSRCGASAAAMLHPRQELLLLLSEIQSGSGTQLDGYLRAAAVLSPERCVIVRLTDAEQRVLTLLSEGNSRAKIALRLYVSENTIKTQTRSLYSKLSARNRAEAVRTAQRLGFLPRAR